MQPFQPISAMDLGWIFLFLIFLWFLTSRSHVIIKKSSSDNFFCSKSLNWRHFSLKPHLEWKKLSLDDFLMTTWERDVKSQRKKVTEKCSPNQRQLLTFFMNSHAKILLIFKPLPKNSKTHFILLRIVDVCKKIHHFSLFDQTSNNLRAESMRTREKL